jgi:hypothetical protein
MRQMCGRVAVAGDMRTARKPGHFWDPAMIAGSRLKVCEPVIS